MSSQVPHTYSLPSPVVDRPRIPSSAAPEKCKKEMVAEEFRTWTTSMLWWIRLNQWQNAEAVGFIRLQCLPDLQRDIDAMYTVDQWTGLSVNDCMEAIKQMVVLPANVAADKEAFYNMKQGPQESISAYFSRAYTTVANCSFKCPSCDYGLENYY